MKKRALKRLKYRHKVGAIIFIFSLIPLMIFGSIFINRLWDAKVEEILTKNRSQLSSSTNDIDNLFLSNINKIIYINNNYYINNFLSSDTDQGLVGVMSFNDYLESVMLAIRADNSATDVNLYSLTETSYNGEYMRTIESLGGNDGDWKSVRDDILRNSDKIIWKFRRLKGKEYTDKVRDYICIYKTIYEMRRPLGIIEIRIPFDELKKYFKYDIPQGSFISYEMENGEVWDLVNPGVLEDAAVSGLRESHSLPELKKQYYVINVDLKAGIGSISMYVPKKPVFEDLKYYLFTIIGILLIITAFLFLSVEIAAFFLTKKLEVLFQKMNTNVESLITNDSSELFLDQDEFGTIESKVHELIQKIKEYYQEKNEYELQRKSLETKLLQERINPHFLYNTLSTLKWITEDKSVQTVIDSMVKYYRIALNKGSSIVTINQELEMISEYLKLQRFAYGNEFEFQIDVEEGVGKFLILKHLLQPVVENAVLHGLSGIETGGRIDIHARSIENKVVIEIIDNGMGMEQDKLEQIMNETSIDNFGGYGMKNIRKRMEIFYGKDYSFEIASAVNVGTTVTITIPGFLDSDIHNSMKEK